MTDETLAHYRRKVRWQMRRGLLELDIILNRFIADGFDALNKTELYLLEAMLAGDDQDLLSVLNGSTEPDDPLQAALAQKIRNSGRA